MSGRIRSSLRASLLAALIALVVVVTGAGAQTTGPLSVNNNTSCTVTVCDRTGTRCATFAPGSVTVNIPCTTGALTIKTACGPLLIPLGQCVQNVNLGNCCADICFVPGFVGCTFFLLIDQVPGPCPCPFE